MSQHMILVVVILFVGFQWDEHYRLLHRRLGPENYPNTNIPPLFNLDKSSSMMLSRPQPGQTQKQHKQEHKLQPPNITVTHVVAKTREVLPTQQKSSSQQAPPALLPPTSAPTKKRTKPNSKSNLFLSPEQQEQLSRLKTPQEKITLMMDFIAEQQHKENLEREKEPPKLDILPDPPSMNLVHTNKTLSACMYILDDTIRLTEWLAYHYIVGPLRHLIIGLDPNSSRLNQLQHLAHLWKQYNFNITIYEQDSWLKEIPELYGWKRRVVYRSNPNQTMDWYHNKSSQEYRSQAHKRRQNIFISQCLIDHYHAGRDWVMVTDSDEFIMYNYYPPSNSSSLSEEEAYDSILVEGNLMRTRRSIDEARHQMVPIRKELPPMQKRFTIADFVHVFQSHYRHIAYPSGAMHKVNANCIRLPALNFTLRQQEPLLSTPLPPGSQHLLTLRQQHKGLIQGLFTKSILDVSAAESEDDLLYPRVDSVHNPNRRICKFNGRSGSGADYKSAVLRIHHYAVGSKETFLERQHDFRRSNGSTPNISWSDYLQQRSFQATGTNKDILPWIDWFMDVMGEKKANELLFDPLINAHKQVQVNQNKNRKI